MFLGIDLAWGKSTATKTANQSGVVALDGSGRITDAGWTVGVEETAGWIDQQAPEDALAFIDAPLVVNNPPKTQRLCEREVGQRYMSPWGVAANSTNLGTKRLGGVVLRELLEERGWAYDDGTSKVGGGRRISECYPYTAIVGTTQLGYDSTKPLYKRKPKATKTADWRSLRATECDDLILRVAALAAADPPVDLTSHETTAALINSPSPHEDSAYKSREDLLDAVLCAWTAAYWSRFGMDGCQVLGLGEPRDAAGRRASIIAPARAEQRRDDLLPSDDRTPSAEDLNYLPLDIPERFVVEVRQHGEWIFEALCSGYKFARSEENGVYYNSEIGMHFRVAENHLDHFVHVDQDGQGDRFDYRIVPVYEDSEGKVHKL